MPADAALVLGAVIGVGIAVLVYLIATGRLRFRFRFRLGPPERGERVIRTIKTTKHTVPPDEPLPEEVAQAPEEARRTGSAERIVINVNGEERVYDSLDDVPAEYRDLIQRHRGTHQSQITIEVNGETHTYRSRDEVPPEFRRFLPPELPQ